MSWFIDCCFLYHSWCIMLGDYMSIFYFILSKPIFDGKKIFLDDYNYYNINANKIPSKSQSYHQNYINQIQQFHGDWNLKSYGIRLLRLYRSDFLYLLHINRTHTVLRCGAICHAAIHDPVIIRLMKLKWFSNQPRHYAKVITGNSTYIITMHRILQLQ